MKFAIRRIPLRKWQPCLRRCMWRWPVDRREACCILAKGTRSIALVSLWVKGRHRLIHPSTIQASQWRNCERMVCRSCCWWTERPTAWVILRSVLLVGGRRVSARMSKGISGWSFRRAVSSCVLLLQPQPLDTQGFLPLHLLQNDLPIS